MTSRRRICDVSAILSACMCSAAGAGLNIDLRATQLNGQSLPPGNTPKFVITRNVGDVISFDIYAVVTGTNAASNQDDKFVSVSGSIRSGPGSIKGNLVADVVRSVSGTPGFDGTGFSVGLQQDLDGDGDLDVDSSVDSDSANFWNPIYALAPAGAAAPNASGVRIGSGSFTVAQLNFAGQVVNFEGRSFATAAQYFQDGQLIQSASSDGVVGIQLDVPEPTSVVPIAGVLLGIAGSQRKKRSEMRGPFASATRIVHSR